MRPFSRTELAAALARTAFHGVFIGTSSWKYPGWLNQVYAPDHYLHKNRFSQSRFEKSCLQEYAQVFKTVCLDAAYYRFPTRGYLESLFSQVPSDFLFALKVTDEITVPRFPRLARYGQRSGVQNPNFLNNDLFCSEFLSSCELWRDQICLLIFEFSPVHRADFRRGRDFVAALDSFLAKLPANWPFGVEVRNPSLLNPVYFGMLRKHKVTHILNSWQRMPPIPEQLQLFDAHQSSACVAARLLLQPGHSYTEAVRAFSPYAHAIDPYPAVREAAALLITRGLDKQNGLRTYIYVNNRLEGNAPETIWAILDRASQL